MQGVRVAERKLGHLVDRVTDGISPEEQLEVLMDAYEQPLYAFLVTVVGMPDLAADCAQDTFLRAYQHLRRRRLVSKSWLYRVAHNRAMDEYRRRERVRVPGRFREEPLERLRLPTLRTDDRLGIGQGGQRLVAFRRDRAYA